jgi:hypothetical protein
MPVKLKCLNTGIIQAPPEFNACFQMAEKNQVTVFQEITEVKEKAGIRFNL